MKTTKEKKNTAIENNIQRYAYQLTINNPENHGCNHLKIKILLIENFSTLEYFCMADEIGAEGTPHTHIYVYFKSRVRFSTVKRHFPFAHIETAFGTTQNNIDYIKKVGKWADSDKAETSIKGTYEEWGKIPIQEGKRSDMELLYRMVNAGYSNAEILARNNDLILNIDKIDKLRTTILMDEFKNKRRLDLRVIYINGATGTGKTRSVLDTFGDSNVFRVTDYEHPFDNYSCQEIIAFDEYRSQFRLSDMLQYCDVYPIELRARYSNKYACFNQVYIISNWTLEEQYTEVQRLNPESWNAFLRRISEVRIYNPNGTIDIYDSVEKYLNREAEFVLVSKETQLEFPFN